MMQVCLQRKNYLKCAHKAHYLASFSRNFAVRGKNTPALQAPAQSLVENSRANVSLAAPSNSKLAAYDTLCKSKLSALVVMTTAAGYMMGPLESFSLMTFGSACVGTSLAAASANTFNQIWERKNDSLMARTQQRPLVTGALSVSQATKFGVSTGLLSTAILAVGCNPLTAALGAFNIGLYSLVYTPMKVRSEWNTWAGSVVGAIPPLMGWTAATGGIMGMEAALLTSSLFLWQFPHFFALSWRLRKDYKRGGFKMIPCNDPTGKRTADLVWKYSAYMTTIPWIAASSGVTSYMFAVEGTAINAYLLAMAYKFKQKANDSNARSVFLCSLWYLPALLGFMAFHKNRDLVESDKKQTLNYLPGSWEELRQKGPQDLFVAIEDVRDRLKGVCIHEYLWGNESSNDALTESNSDSSSKFCPVVVTEAAVDVAADVSVDAAATIVGSKQR